MTGQDGISSSFVETVAGFTAGIVSTLCLHPLDLVKTRLQGKSLPLLLLLIQCGIGTCSGPTDACNRDQLTFP
jgi:hypothetical protein